MRMRDTAMPTRTLHNQLTRTLLEHLLPAACLLCGDACPQALLCRGCDADLPRIDAYCQRCGLPVHSANELGDTRLCAACTRQPPAWDHAIAALAYEYPVDHLVRNFKFGKDLACGQLLAQELVRAVMASEPEVKQLSGWPDLLVPVPLHFLRRWKRSFNQAELLADELHRACGIRVERGVLRRIRATPAQSGLDRKARQRNLDGAFRCEPLGGQHVALVDDVLTTGVTLQECTRELKRAGAAKISVWVAARVPAPGH